MNIAHKIKSLDNFRGEAILFRMEPPLESYDYVVVSAVNPKLPEGMTSLRYTDMFIPETYIFGADPDGTVLDWRELPGSFQGAMDIPRALAQAGYEIKEQA
jgi:hypothetical protein